MDNIGAPPMFTSNNFFAPLLVSLSGVACASVAIFLYHFFLVRYCRRRRRRRAALENMAALQIHADTRRHFVSRGLDPRLLETVPVVPYSSAREQTECVVCIGELEEGDMVRVLPNCRHAFHAPCIDRWFAAHSNCPVCRSRLEFETIDGAGNTNSGEVGGSDADRAVAADASSSGVAEMHSCGLLRHCASLVILPMERRSSPKRLKRSLSMDLSFVVDMPSMEGEDDDQRHCSLPFGTGNGRGILP